MTWQPADFEIATPDGPQSVGGYSYKGLGLHRGVGTAWTLTHLNTGHSICTISGRVKIAFPIAAEIAECTDWDFDGVRGWKNRDPDMGSKVRAVLGRHKGAVFRHDDGPETMNEHVAAEIARRRA